MCLLVGLAADLLQIGQEVIHQRNLAVRLRRRAKAALHLIKMRQFTAQLDKCLARSIGLAAIPQRSVKLLLGLQSHNEDIVDLILHGVDTQAGEHRFHLFTV